MKKNNLFSPVPIGIALLIFTAACNAPKNDAASKTDETAMMEVAEPDLAKLKTDIQAMENAWAEASNSKDKAKIVAFYADDAISMENNKPMAVGKAAIQKGVEAYLAERKASSVVAYETMEVFGDDNMLTEIGKTTMKDAAGKVMSTGKYMALWEKRNDKWLVIRDIYNDDVKEK